MPEKPANKIGLPTVAELVEERGLTKENIGQSLLDRTQNRNTGGPPSRPGSHGLYVRETSPTYSIGRGRPKLAKTSY